VKISDDKLLTIWYQELEDNKNAQLIQAIWEYKQR
jgi:hypothetical protein